VPAAFPVVAGGTAVQSESCDPTQSDLGSETLLCFLQAQFYPDC